MFINRKMLSIFCVLAHTRSFRYVHCFLQESWFCVKCISFHYVPWKKIRQNIRKKIFCPCIAMYWESFAYSSIQVPCIIHTNNSTHNAAEHFSIYIKFNANKMIFVTVLRQMERKFQNGSLICVEASFGNKYFCFGNIIKQIYGNNIANKNFLTVQFMVNTRLFVKLACIRS